MNKVFLIGHLTRDIELRYSSAGLAFGACAIATTRKFTDANGSKQEETLFIDITFFGRYAEVANQYLHKGSKVMIEGRLRLESWQDKNTGQSRQKHSVIVENMQMLDNKPNYSDESANGGGYSGSNNGYSANNGYGSNNGYSTNNSYSANNGYYAPPQKSIKDEFSGLTRTQIAEQEKARKEALGRANMPPNPDDGIDEIPF